MDWYTKAVLTWIAVGLTANLFAGGMVGAASSSLDEFRGIMRVSIVDHDYAEPMPVECVGR